MENNQVNNDNQGVVNAKILHKQMIALEFKWLPLIAKIAITACLYFSISDLGEYFFLVKILVLYVMAALVVGTFVIIPSIFGGIFAIALECCGIGYVQEMDIIQKLADRFGTSTDNVLTMAFASLGLILFLFDMRKFVYYIKYVLLEKAPN